MYVDIHRYGPFTETAGDGGVIAIGCNTDAVRPEREVAEIACTVAADE